MGSKIPTVVPTAPDSFENRPRLESSEIHLAIQGLKGQVVDVAEMSHEKQVLLDALRQGILGQEEACNDIADRLSTGLNRLMYKKGPLGIVFLSGPTGVGKTESVRVLAKTLVGDENGYTRINCEQFQEAHTARDLFGAPKSYVGYGSPTTLAAKNIFKAFEDAKKAETLHPIIRGKSDFGILLFDEIEKAHPDVLQSLLAILDDGKTTFSNGTTTSFANVFIVMTSNIGQGEISRSQSKGVIGFRSDSTSREQQEQEIFQRELEQEFSPEFLGRIGTPIRFQEIQKKDCISIIQRAIDQANNDLHRYFCDWNIHIGISDAAIAYLVEKGFNPKQGARQLMKVLDRYILAPTNITLRKHAGEDFLRRKNPTILYYDIDERDTIQSQFFMPTLFNEPKDEENVTESHIDTTLKQAEGLLSIAERMKDLTEILEKAGFSTEDIGILMYIDKQYSLTSLREVDHTYDGKNIYKNVNIFGANYSPRWIKTLINKKAKDITQQGEMTREVYFLILIARSIRMIEILLGGQRLSKEQENIVIRFASIAVCKTWGIV